MQADTVLLDAAKGMDEDAITKIFDTYAPALFNYALRTGSDPHLADHIVGDVFAKLLDQLSGGNGPRSNLRSYLFQMAYHMIVDEVRYSKRRISLEAFELLPQNGYSSQSGSETRLAYEVVLKAIHDDLSIGQRHVIVLRFLEGFNIRETAEILGKTESSVKVTQNRAITALRKVLRRHVVS